MDNDETDIQEKGSFHVTGLKLQVNFSQCSQEDERNLLISSEKAKIIGLKWRKEL